MKSVLLFCFALLALCLQASAPLPHKFYLSNTSIEFNAQTRAIEITSKIFTDDLEHAIEAQCYRYHSLYPQTPEVFELVKKYIGEKLSLQVAGRNVVLNFITYMLYIYIKLEPMHCVVFNISCWFLIALASYFFY